MTFPHFTRRSVLRTGTALGVARSVMPGMLAHAQTMVPRIRVASDIQHLDPFDQIGGVEETVKAATLVTLIRYKQQGSTEWEPYAAESIDVVDDTTIAFTLRDDIVWTGGFGPLTAHDVKFSFERMADPEGGSPWQYAWDLLDNVEVIDDRNGVIHMKEPFAPLFYTSLPWYAGQIVCKQAVEEAGGTFTTEIPAECGPYLTTAWEPKISLTLSRNADWTVDRPDFDGFEIIVITDDKSAEIAFEAGELDFTLVSPDSISQLRQNMPQGAKLLELPSINYTWLGMNVENPKLQDIKVRQAIQYAVDVDQIMEGAYAGAAEPSTGVQAPGTVGYRDKRQIGHVDLDKARALLAEAGVPDGFDVTLTTLNDTLSVTVCQIIQANLAEIGINVELAPYDPGIYWNLGLESEGEDWKNLELTLMAYGGGIDPSENLIWFTPDQVGVWNWERWNNAEFGELYAQGNVELDPDKRNAIYQRMQDLMEESGAYVFLTHGALAALYRDWMEPFVRYDRTLALPQFRSV